MIMNTKIYIIIISLFFGAKLSSQQAMSLTQAIDYALANHPDVRIANLNVKDAEWRVKENKSIALPHLSLGANYNYYIQQPALPAEAIGIPGAEGQKISFALQTSINGKIELNQLLFSNEYLVGIKGARMYHDYVQLQLDAVKEEVRNKVRDAYIPALLLTKSVEILDKNIENQQELVDETQAIQKAGFAEQLDVDRLEYLLSNLKTRRENLSLQKEIVVNALKFQLNIPVSQVITVSDDMDALLADYTSINPDEALDYMNRPDYVAILKQEELQAVQVELYEKDWLPTLNLFGSYDPSFQGNNNLYWIPSALAGVSLRMNIYDGGWSKAKQERATIQALQVTEYKNVMIQGFDLEIENARVQYRTASQEVQDQERNLALAQRIHETSETKFKAGLGSSFEVTQAQAGFYQTQANLVNAQFNLLEAIVALKKALGQP